MDLMQSALVIVSLFHHQSSIISMAQNTSDYGNVSTLPTNDYEDVFIPFCLECIDNYTAQLEVLRLCKECQPRTEPFQLHILECVPCMCDLDCLKYGDCCIDIMIRQNLHTMEVNSVYECVPLKYFPFPMRGMESRTDGLYMVIQYDDPYGNGLLSCDTNNLWPVTCRGSGKTFPSMACAWFNSQVDCEAWNVQTECSSSDNWCQGYMIPQEYVEVRYCDSSRLSQIISWCAPDFENTSYAHEQYTHLCRKYNYLVYYDNMVFRNIFCYICNYNHLALSMSPIESNIITLTGFTERFEKAVQKESCDGTKAWMDYSANKCRPIRCYSDKILVGGYCLTENRTALGTEYHVVNRIELTTSAKEAVITQAITNIMGYFSFDMFSTNYQLTTSEQIYQNGVSFVYLSIWFVINKNVSMFDFEYNIRFFPRYIATSFSQLHMTTKLDYTTLSPSYPVHKTFKVDEATGLCCLVEGELDIENKMMYNPISHQLECSHIEFDQGEYSVIGSVAFVAHLNLTLMHSNFSVFNDKLIVCFEDFLDQTGFVYNNKTIMYTVSVSDEHGVSQSEYYGVISLYLTIVCISISLLSLFITFVTHVTFKELRTQPGINTLSLVVHLFLAQVALLTGMRQVDHPVLCKALGICIHYLWLSMLFWMNICSYHMFMVFVIRKLAPVAYTKGVRQTVKYAAYGNGVPVLIVVTTVVVHLVLSGGQDIGYGGVVCYLSNRKVVGYVFVVPLCLIIFSNVVFFFCTMITIHRVKQTGIQTGERNNVYIYVKLSMVSGIFWLFNILSNVVNSEIMEYIAVVLNGSQGFFILWSFILNRKVLRKWRGRFERITTTSTASSQVNS